MWSSSWSVSGVLPGSSVGQSVLYLLLLSMTWGVLLTSCTFLDLETDTIAIQCGGNWKTGRSGHASCKDYILCVSYGTSRVRPVPIDRYQQQYA